MDAIYLRLGGADAVHSVYQYAQAGGDVEFLAGSIMVEGPVLDSKGKTKALWIGAPLERIADIGDDPRGQAFVKAYHNLRPP